MAMLGKIFKWGGIPVSFVFGVIGVYSLAKEADTWGFPDWAWLSVGVVLFFATGISIIVGFWHENKILKANTAIPTSNTVVISDSVATYEQIKKTVIADIQSGNIKIKGVMPYRLEDLSKKDVAFIKVLSEQMEAEIGHGHGDILGLLADRASGVPINELINSNCSICKKPRNQSSDDEGVTK